MRHEVYSSLGLSDPIHIDERVRDENVGAYSVGSLIPKVWFSGKKFSTVRT
jgi:hypothetical protein